MNQAVISIHIPQGGKYADDISGIVLPAQTHTCNVKVAEGNDDFRETDALVSFNPGTEVGVRTADCVPVMIYAPDVRAVAAVHAGWKGTLGRIVENVVKLLEDRGADPAGMKAFIGPSICQDCYEVDASLAEKFREASFDEFIKYGITEDPLEAVEFSPERPHLDLKGINGKILTDCGIPYTSILVSRKCTRHSESPEGFIYPSWRRFQDETARIITSIRISTLNM